MQSEPTRDILSNCFSLDPIQSSFFLLASYYASHCHCSSQSTQATLHLSGLPPDILQSGRVNTACELNPSSTTQCPAASLNQLNLPSSSAPDAVIPEGSPPPFEFDQGNATPLPKPEQTERHRVDKVFHPHLTGNFKSRHYYQSLHTYF